MRLRSEFDGGPILPQHLVNVSCLLGQKRSEMYIENDNADSRMLTHYLFVNLDIYPFIDSESLA